MLLLPGTAHAPHPLAPPSPTPLQPGTAPKRRGPRSWWAWSCSLWSSWRVRGGRAAGGERGSILLAPPPPPLPLGVECEACSLRIPPTCCPQDPAPRSKANSWTTNCQRGRARQQRAARQWPPTAPLAAAAAAARRQPARAAARRRLASMARACEWEPARSLLHSPAPPLCSIFLPVAGAPQEPANNRLLSPAGCHPRHPHSCHPLPSPAPYAGAPTASTWLGTCCSRCLTTASQN